MKRKVVWIVNEYNGPDNIRSRQSVLCQRLIECGYDCYVVSGSAKHKDGGNSIKGKNKFEYVESDGAKHYVIKTSSYKRSFERILVSIQFQRRLWKLRKSLPEPNVIVSDFAGLFGNVFLKWKKKYGTKVIYDILDLWPEGFVNMGYIKKSSLLAKYLYGLEHKSYKNADGIIFSFQGGKDYLIDKGWSKEFGGDVDTSDIGYLNNGVDLESFFQNKSSFVYDDADLKSDKFKIIYLGSISAFNGIDKIVESARVLKERSVSNAVFLVYGYGNQDAAIRQLINKYKLDNIIMKGKIDKRFAPSLLSQGDLNIFTFKNTGLLKYGVSPNKLFMYFASGKPVLSMIKPAYDLVEDRKCGVSVDNSPELVADKIIEFINMSKEQYNLYCHNSSCVAQEYDYKNLVKELIRFIEK